MVQEDGAAPHIHWHHAQIYSTFQVMKLLWPGNSPNLNPIEKAWFYLKQVTTSRGPPKDKIALEHAWLQAWRQLSLAMVRKWIEAIPHHIQEIIRLEGGNEYPEGRKAFKREWKGRRTLRKLSTHAYLHPQQDEVLEESEGG